MIQPVTFEKHLIAPCGMNCGTCIAYLRDKNKCPGCRIVSSDKAISVKKCTVTECIYLQKTTSKFCYDCEKYPCKRIKDLDKRYSTKYRTSFIENLAMIEENGLDRFLAFEAKRRTCNHCGSVLSVHRNNCIKCNQTIN
jgi:hypothetical protein